MYPRFLLYIQFVIAAFGCAIALFTAPGPIAVFLVTEAVLATVVLEILTRPKKSSYRDKW